jgi:hypothetical protein
MFAAHIVTVFVFPCILSFSYVYVFDTLIPKFSLFSKSFNVHHTTQRFEKKLSRLHSIHVLGQGRCVGDSPSLALLERTHSVHIERTHSV